MSAVIRVTFQQSRLARYTLGGGGGEWGAPPPLVRASVMPTWARFSFGRTDGRRRLCVGARLPLSPEMADGLVGGRTEKRLHIHMHVAPEETSLAEILQDCCPRV